MIKKEENKEENNNNLKKPEPFAHKNWTELIKPTKIDVDKKDDNNSIGSVTIEPLERIVGITAIVSTLLTIVGQP